MKRNRSRSLGARLRAAEGKTPELDGESLEARALKDLLDFVRRRIIPQPTDPDRIPFFCRCGAQVLAGASLLPATPDELVDVDALRPAFSRAADMFAPLRLSPYEQDPDEIPPAWQDLAMRFQALCLQLDPPRSYDDAEADGIDLAGA